MSSSNLENLSPGIIKQAKDLVQEWIKIKPLPPISPSPFIHYLESPWRPADPLFRALELGGSLNSDQIQQLYYKETESPGTTIEMMSSELQYFYRKRYPRGTSDAEIQSSWAPQLKVLTQLAVIGILGKEGKLGGNPWIFVRKVNDASNKVIETLQKSEKGAKFLTKQKSILTIRKRKNLYRTVGTPHVFSPLKSHVLGKVSGKKPEAELRAYSRRKKPDVRQMRIGAHET